jgi:hypothetical protein
MRLLRWREMRHTRLGGAFVIRYPDLPRRGPELDGDTVKFRLALRRFAKPLPKLRAASPPDAGLDCRPRSQTG